MKQLNMALLSAVVLLSVTACGGSGSETVDKAVNRVNDNYQKIEDSVKDSYKKIEDKLSDDEKSTAEILKGIFVPEQSLENFLDKLTPEGGKGGLYVGHFVEDDDGETDDIDIGAVYFDVGKDVASSVYGQMSYQQKTCQNSNLLTTDNASIKAGTLIGGVLNGHLDPIEKFDNRVLNFLKFDEIKTNVEAMPFNGRYDTVMQKWQGDYSYQLGFKLSSHLSSNIQGCSVKYTLGEKGNFYVYPLTYQLGNLNLQMVGIGSTTQLNWTNPANTAYVMVSQIDVDKATDKGNGFVVNNVLQNTQQFSPSMSNDKANYAFVVQAFDKDKQLIAYQAIVKGL